MIEWLSLAELDAHRDTLTPIGVELDTVFCADPVVAPSDWYDRPGEPRVEELGPSHVWCGVSNGVPFEVVAVLDRFSVRLPNFTAGDAARLAVLDGLDLPRWTRPYFRSTPHGDGFAVVDGHGSVIANPPTYWSASRDAALACLDFVRRRAPAARQVVVLRDRPPCWFVDGPRTAELIPIRSILPSLEKACRHARWLSQRHGVLFDVTDSRNVEPRLVEPEADARRSKTWRLPP